MYELGVNAYMLCKIKGVCILDEVYIRFEVFVPHRYRLQNIHVYHYLLKERTLDILDIVAFLNPNIIYTKDLYTLHTHLICDKHHLGTFPTFFILKI